MPAVPAAQQPLLPLPIAWEQLDRRHGRYFKIVFRRKGNQKNGPGLAGDLRAMTCRIGVKCFRNDRTGLGFYSIPGEVRHAEDLRCDVMTVHDLEMFRNLRAQGVNRNQAGRQSYRRVNVAQVVSIQPWIDD